MGKYRKQNLCENVPFIVKIQNLYIILLCTYLYHTSFRYLSITCNTFIAHDIRHKKYLIGIN